MNKADWSKWTDQATVNRRSGGRRRYNAQRRQVAEARREEIAAYLLENPAAWLFPRGLPAVLAPAFGVHPCTISRDLGIILYGPRRYTFHSGGKFLYAIERAYAGGPVLTVEDAAGNEIRGLARREILAVVPRYVGRARRRP